MFLYGVPIGNEAAYERLTKRSIARVAAPGDKVMELRGRNSIFNAYNDVLLAARKEAELEGVVLMHQDVELTGDELPGRLREEFADPAVWIAGAIGGAGVRSPRWWDAPSWHGSVLENPYPELGTGLPRRALKPVHGQDTGTPADVDVLDGLLLALSPTAVRELLFDERIGPSFHCYDTDICLQARARSGRVRVVEVGLVHHSTGGLSGYDDAYATSHERVARKWDL